MLIMRKLIQKMLSLIEYKEDILKNSRRGNLKKLLEMKVMKEEKGELE